MSAPIRTVVVAVVALAIAGTAVTVVSAAGELDSAERATLLAMREEEKLAHDVYVTLGAETGLAVFTRIASSEVRHERAIERLLTRYGVVDPTDGLGVGEFASARFQSLYDELVAEGSASRRAALGVGVRIETLDIRDLQAAIRRSDEPQLDRTYESLLAASRQHLAAFQRAG